MLDATFLFFCVLFFVFYSLGMYLLGKLSVDDKDAYLDGYDDGWCDAQTEAQAHNDYEEGFRDGYLTAKWDLDEEG